MIFLCNLKKCWVSFLNLKNLSLSVFLTLMITPLEHSWSFPEKDLSSTNKNVSYHYNLSQLKQLYKTQWKSTKDLGDLAKESWKLGPAATPLLLEVMKSSSYPDNNRWVATMCLAKAMGNTSIKVLARFSEHPYWMMRLASVKALAQLKASSVKAQEVYEKLLKDESLVVRSTALEILKNLQLKSSATKVYEVIADERNYHFISGQKKSTEIVDQAVILLGKWKYHPAKKTFKELLLKDDSITLSYALDYSLEQMTGKNSPRGNLEVKKNFWKNMK